MNDFIISVTLSSFFLLDSTYVGQFLLSQPVIMIPILSCFTRDTATALKTAVNLELVYLGRLAVGASIPPFAGFGAAVFWSSYLLLKEPSVTALVILFFLAMGAAYWGRTLEIAIRKMNEPITRWSFYSYAKTGNRLCYYRGGALSLLATFLLYGINITGLSFAASQITTGILILIPDVMAKYSTALEFFWNTLPIIAVLFLLDRFMEKGRSRFFYYGALGGLLGGIMSWIL